jgi:hypothetical protein
MIVADTSGLLALYNGAEPAHAGVAGRSPRSASPSSCRRTWWLSWTTWSPPASVRAALAVLRELGGGAYLLPCLTRTTWWSSATSSSATPTCGSAWRTRPWWCWRTATPRARLLTLDRRRFDAVRTLGGAPFTLVP